ncbi:hypothetical protein PFISCL1PPCAC_29035, partial [Pristionchus fissidentatus]
IQSRPRRSLPLFPMSEEADHSTTCLVCSAPTSSIHFGIESCRACSIFFKRSVVAGRQFPCKRSQRDCVIEQDDKAACRRCRYDKCLAAGMVYDRPLRTCRKRPLKAVQAEPHADVANVPSTSKDTLIARVAREYRTSFERRHELEQNLLSECDDLVRVPHPSKEIYTTNNYGVYMKIFNFSFIEMLRFFESTFPTLANLPFKDRRLLFRAYILKFTTMENFHRTLQIWGGVGTYGSMCSIMTCLHMDSLEDLMAPHKGGANRKTIFASMRVYLKEQIALIIPTLERAAIDETELHAIFALLVCDTDLSPALSESVIVAVEEIRAEVLRNLHEYYTKEGLADYSTRLGHIMSVCGALQENSSLFREQVRMQATLFDIFDSETMLKELMM